MKARIRLLCFIYCIIFLQGINANLQSAPTVMDSLQKYSSNDLKKLSIKHYYTNISLAKIYAQEILNRGLKNVSIKEKINGYHQLGVIEVIKGNHKKSLSYFDKGLQLVEKDQDESNLLKFYLNKGNAYLYLDNYKQALFYYEKTISIAKKLKKTGYEITAYLNIALIKKDLGQFKEALKIEKENIKRAEKINLSDTRTNVSLFINLSGTFLNLKENDSAIYYAQKGILLSNDVKDLEGSSYLYNIIGASYQNKKKDRVALDYFYKSLTIIKKLQNNKRVSATYYMLAKSYNSLKNKEKAISYLQKAEGLVDTIKNFQSYELTKTYKLFAKIYTSQNKRQLANHYFQKYIESDSLIDSNKTATIEDLYYKDLKEKDSQLEKASNQKYNLKFLLITGLLFLTISILVLIAYIKKSKKNQERFEVLYQKTLHSAKAITNRATHKINDEKAKEILTKLKKIEAQEYFLKSDFSLNTLAKKLKTNPSYLSRVINIYKQKQFNEYTNELRISYALKRLEVDTKFRSYSILYISKELGYKSQDSFSKHFKKRTGTNPSFYIANMKKPISYSVS